MLQRAEFTRHCWQETWLKERKITKRIYSSVHHGAWEAPARLKFYAATPLVIRTALFDSQLFFYNSRLREWVANGGCPPSLHFLVGTVGFMLAGLVAATVNYPFDRVKGPHDGPSISGMTPSPFSCSRDQVIFQKFYSSPALHSGECWVLILDA